MAERMIGKLGDPVLRKICKPVTEITSNILQLLNDMADTLTAAPNGAALAAPQIGVALFNEHTNQPLDVYDLIKIFRQNLL